MHIPIIGNGDVTTPQPCKECFDRYGVDAVMIGHASFGHPWIFKEVKHYLETGEELPPLSFEWCMEVLRQDFRNARIAMLRSETKEELFRIFDEITANLSSTEEKA